MSVVRRVVRREVGELTATETLECDHVNVLYREIRNGRVAWRSQRGAATNLSVKSRECAECAAAVGRAARRGWPV